MVKNQKGFTLVEVIVVAVIVAVLAAVAIPLYNGYIADSRMDVAENIAGSAASACGATLQQFPNNSRAGTYTGPTTIPFPSRSGQTNVINVPNDFQVVISATNAICTYVPNNLTSQPYVYTSGS